MLPTSRGFPCLKPFAQRSRYRRFAKGAKDGARPPFVGSRTQKPGPPRQARDAYERERSTRIT